MPLNKKLFAISKKAVPILKKNGVIEAGIFGSYAKGTENKKSDIDFLIKFKGKKTLYDLVGLKHELEEGLNKKVDVVTYNSINHLIKNEILNHEVKIL